MKYRYLLPGVLCLASQQIVAQTPQLEEIIVTAGFRDIGLQSQPVSTSVVTAEAISLRAAQHLEEVLNLAPNVNYASGASRARFYQIRGVGERGQFQAPLNPSVGFMVDGVDFSGLGTMATLFDVEQVEVLRGPQGTLHGANALAGLINVRTGDPTDKPYLRMEATLADYDTYSAGIVGSGPLVADELLYRLSVNHYGSDGFIENDYLDKENTNNREETSIRGKLRWLASDTHTVDITGLYADIANGYDAFSLDNTRHTLSDQPGQDEQESGALALHWHAGLGKVDLESALSVATSETDYGYDEDWSFVGIAPGWEYSSTDQYLRDRDSYTAELRILSRENTRLINQSTDWVVGLYYLGDREDLRRRYTYLERDFLSRYDTDTLAGYGQLDSRLSERLSLVTGLRVENRQTDYSDSNAVDEDLDETLWGGKILLQYQLSDDSMLYAGVSRGYRAYGVNAEILASIDSTDDPAIIEQLREVATYDDEHLINYEAGLKSSYLEDALHTRLALFYMDREDQQVAGSVSITRDDGSTAFISYTSNSARGNNYGLELEMEWSATEALSLYANIGLLETEFDEFVTAEGIDLSGREQAHAPSYQYALGGRLNFARGLYLSGGLEGKGDYYVSDSHNVKSPSYNLLNLRLGYADQNWSVALWGRNLTDEEYVVRGFNFANDPRKEYITEPYFQYGEPRILGITAGYTF